MEDGTGGKIKSARQRVLRVFARGHDFLLRPFGHPSHADFGQQMAIAFIRKRHHLMRVLLLRMEADADQALDPLRIILFRHQFGPLPDPAQCVEPAPHGLVLQL
jgi:hypothetical protein